MDRVYDTGVSATPTALPDAPETGYPIAGDPLTSTPATKPGAYWFYMITESIRRVLVAAGITPDHEDLDLLNGAIDAKITAGIAPAASETVAGKAELATQAEALTGTDDARIMTPLKVTKLFSDTGRQSLATSGYQKLPGGLIIQWGTVSVDYDSTDTTVTFPVSFPTSVISAVATVKKTTVVSGVLCPYVHTFSTTGMSILGDSDEAAASGVDTCWIAIGY